MNMGAFVRYKRLALGYSQEEVARAVGWAYRGQVCNLEKGRYEWKLGDFQVLARFFGCVPSELLREYEEFNRNN